MASQKTSDEVKSAVFNWLKGTRYASTSLDSLSGGSMNFIYRAHLSEPLEDGTTDVLVKHSEDYSAANYANKVTINRCRIEEQCLNALVHYRITPDPADLFKYDVKTPKCHFYDDETHTQVQEYLQNGINLKSYAIQNFPSPTPKSFQPQCHQLGKELAQWITKFHRKTGDEIELKLHVELKENKEMQSLKHMINYDWLIQCVDRFPEILTESRELFVKIKEQALEELQHNQNLTFIHGDFWTGNILIPNEPIQEGVEIPVLVTDWETAQLGVPALDHGEMIGELYELWLYKKIDAGLWMVQGYAEGLGTQTVASVWYNALHVGVHLLSFGTGSNWGTRDETKEVGRLGRDIIENAWRRNRHWFENSELNCLFTQVRWDETSSSEIVYTEAKS